MQGFKKENKKFRSLSKILVVSVLLFSSAFTFILTSISFYYDYKRRIGGLSSTFDKIESSTVHSIANSVRFYDQDTTDVLAKGILSIPEIYEVRIKDIKGSEKYVYKKELKSSVELSLAERFASKFFTTSMSRSAPLHNENASIGSLYYEASTIGLYGGLVERLFIFFFTQALKTFAVSTFILLICRLLFTRKLGILAEKIQKSERMGYFDSAELLGDSNKAYFSEIDVLVHSIVQFHEVAEIKKAEQNRLRDTSEKVLWLVRDHDISEFTNSNIIKNSNLDHCHFYSVEGEKLVLHSSFSKSEDLISKVEIKQKISINGIEDHNDISKITLPNDEEAICMPIQRGGSLLGVFLGFGSEQIIDDMIEKRAFWLTMARIVAMALIHARLYENLEESIQSRTQRLNVNNQELNKAKLQLQQVVENKKLLLRILCHDLNNPIATMKGACYNLIHKENIDKKKYYHKIEKAAEKQTALIEFIRHFQAIEDVKIQFNTRKVYFSSFYSSIMLNFEKKFIEKDITFQYIELDPSLQIEVDPVPFEDIIINNIVSNAIKFTDLGGKISIAARKKDAEYVEIQVSDNGIGIPKNILKNLFDAHEPSTRPGTSGERGTGYGMPLVKALVKHFKGEISVLSKSKDEYPNEHGTTFFLTFKLVATKKQVNKKLIAS